MYKDQEFFFWDFATTIGSTRRANYYLGCSDGAVYLDFDNDKDGSVRLIRISFDRYGCCDLGNMAKAMDETDSAAFRAIFNARTLDQPLLNHIIKKTIANNKERLWEDALTDYDLL